MARGFLFLPITPNFIKTYIKQLKRAFRSEKIQAYGLLILAVVLIGIKGFASDQGFFTSVVHSYIEETAASVSETIQPELADISDLLALNSQAGSDVSVSVSFIQNNSVQAYEPPSTDYINDLKGNKIIEYTVQPGDAISFIASDFGVTVNTILWANNIKNADSISPGQVLKIPPVSGVVHGVRPGDTLASVAKKYGADLAKILDFNDLKETDSLRAGTQLVIPDGKMAKTASPASTTKKFAYLPDLDDYFVSPTVGYDWGIIHGRNGVDIANSCGTSVYAAATGNTEIADAIGYNGGFGKYIKLVHPNGTETLYAHLSKLVISTGEYIQKGQLIGLMGTTGRSTGCHLHFEVHGARHPLAKY